MKHAVGRHSVDGNERMRAGFDEHDADALSALANAPPPNSAGSLRTHSQQLRSNTGTHFKRHRHRHHRKHSLDEIGIPSISSPSSSGDDNDEFHPYATATSSAFNADHNSISHDDEQHPLTEFSASGGGGVFKAPNRAAVHPARPACLELRPHPLRETQVGRFIRTIACTENQLWAGQESGVRFWNFCDSFEPGLGIGGRAARGDEDAAPFYESVGTSATTCLVIDGGSKLVWSGHKDGKIRSWKMDQTPMDDAPFKEGLSWQAHRGPILSMVISSYGDVWTGFEGGVIRVWPWEALEKSLSLSLEERHMAALLVERAFIDLRSQVTVNGSCHISSSDVKYLLSDNVNAKVWVAGSLSFSLWDARTRALLKVYNVDGHIENRVDTSSKKERPHSDEPQERPHDHHHPPLPEDDAVANTNANVKPVPKSKKEKPQGGGGGNFFQRSRNALLGAAGAVRRVATKGTGAFAAAEDAKKTEAILLAYDGMIWTGCSNGVIVQWDPNGNRLRDFHHHHCAVLCFCTYGPRIWVGYVSGMVQVIDLRGNLVAAWIAHNGPVIKLVVGNGSVFSLATHGGIRGWYISAPGPLDNILRPELSKREQMYTTRENVKIMVGTWNVGQGKPSQDALVSWLGSRASDVGILVVGLQEVEMGAGFLAMSAAKETIGVEGSSNGQWWQDAIGKTLDEGLAFERVGSRQLAGLLIAIWVKKSLRTHVGDLDVAAVACGLGRTFGNKGGVGLRLRVYDRIMCFLNCHLAAHLEAVNRRNADFNHIYRNISFGRSANNASPEVSSTAQTLRPANSAVINPEEGKPDLAEADMVIFCGDFNYRLFGITYDEARDFVSQRSFDWLREKDQLWAEMKAGKVFQGMREALVTFPPTYKFERGKPGLGGYDSGEKKRIPAWCDRILYRDSRSSPTPECNLRCPVVASIFLYEACMDVTDSDHKPVRCKFNVQIAHVDRSVRRREFGKIFQSHEEIASIREELRYIPKTALSTDRIVLRDHDTGTLTVTNTSRKDDDVAMFEILCEGESVVKADESEATEHRPRGSFGFPRWLEVNPAVGIIKPGQAAEVSLRHEDILTSDESIERAPQSSEREDVLDKEVFLSVVTRGSRSTETTSQRCHVRHYSTAKNMVRVGSSKGHSSKMQHGGVAHQSGSQKHSDTVDKHGHAHQLGPQKHSDTVDKHRFAHQSGSQKHSDTVDKHRS